MVRKTTFDDERVSCQTPSAGKQSASIQRWKYDTVRRAILQAVSGTGDGLAFKDLPGEVARALSAEERSRLGSVSWYTTVVKLDLEVKGELRRVPGARPQRLTPK